MHISWKEVFIIITTLIVIFLVFLIFAIAFVSSLTKKNAITLHQGIMVFAISITAALVVVGVIWTLWRRRHYK